MDKMSGADSSDTPAPRQVVLERLKVRPDFLRVAATRRRHAMPGLVLQVADTPAADVSAAEHRIRVGFTATRKIGAAVTRNRARRRLRAVAAKILPAHAKSGRDYVVIARGGTATRPYEKLVADMETALRRLDSWHNGTKARD